MAKLSINLEDKPHLARAMSEERGLAKEVMQTFAQLMDDAFNPERNDNSTRWVDLPKMFHDRLTFRALINGILRGTLDVKDINPEAFPVIHAEVHPLALLKPKPSKADLGIAYTQWRRHFQQPADTIIDEDLIANIIQKILRHAKWVRIEMLQKALEANQVVIHRGLGDQEMEKLPFFPALRYQERTKGELHVGRFFDDNGFFDCGKMPEQEDDCCPACKTHDLVQLGNQPYKGCLACNAGFAL